MLQAIKRFFASPAPTPTASEQEEAKLQRIRQADPLDPFAAIARAEHALKGFGGNQMPNPIKVTAKNFPHLDLLPENVVASFDEDGMESYLTDSDLKHAVIGDNASAINAIVMDDSSTLPADMGFGMGSGLLASQIANPAVLSWYMQQSFIGWQACAIIAQHWLIDKACTMPGDDACRNGWVLKTKSGDDLSAEQNELLTSLDVEFKVMENLSEFNRFKNIFGIRVAIFEVDSDDPKYYEKPFNIDGIKPGSYKGISQVDPYWMMPLLTSQSTTDPSSRFFYEPEYWVISGRRYHRSHLIISRGPQPADILKPTYIFGGIPRVQQLYERVYAAERTANEAPLLSLSKRTTAIHVDLAEMAANQEQFEQKLLTWVKYRDNHAVKVLGINEAMEQFDISLTDFDSIIMNQYQLVAAIAKMPATELLGTSPKGFNATGEFEMKSYNKELVSIQAHTFTPLLDRHYLLLAKSKQIDVELKIVWNSTDTPTAKELAELNDKKADTDTKNVTIGAISPDDVRNRLRDDDHSGYGRLSDEEANAEPGMSPEILAKLQTANAQETRSEAQTVTAGAHAEAAGTTPAAASGLAQRQEGEEQPTDETETTPSHGGTISGPTRAPNDPLIPELTREPGINQPQAGETARSMLSALANPAVLEGVKALAFIMGKIDDLMVPEGAEVSHVGPARGSVRPSVRPSVSSLHDVIPVETDHTKLPKTKFQGLNIAIENPRGTVRKGMNLDGQTWQAKMHHHYGFIKGVIGADGDELDCFVGLNGMADKVYVINQNDPNTGAFDEHKVMLGFDDADAAKKGYDDSFSDGWTGFDSIVELSMDEFRQWIGTGQCTTPLSKECIGTTQSHSLI
jgi:phage-related protein (TIGR01555 family)